MKLHVAMGHHPPFLCQQPVDRLVDSAQHLDSLSQIGALDVALMGQDGQLV